MRIAKLITRRKITVAAATLAALALAACGSSSSSSSGAGGPSATSSASGTSSQGSAPAGVATAKAALAPYLSPPTKINVTTPLNSKPPAGKTIVTLGTNDPGNVDIMKGVSSIANQAGWTVSSVTYDPANPSTFNSALDTALAKHPDYVVEAGLPLTAQSLQKVAAAHAKWALSSVYPANVKPPVIVNANDYQSFATMGKIVADYFVSDSNGKGNAVVEHVPAYPILDAFTNVFSSRVKAECPSCAVKIVNVSIPDLAAGKLPSAMVSALKSNPSANYLVFDNANFATGIDSALAAAGLKGKVKVIGAVTNPTVLAALKNGTEDAWAAFDPNYLGYQVMDGVFRDAEGMPVPQQLEGVEPTQLITKANVGSTTNWSYPSDAPAQFKALWHLP
jgi:ribose transport system substrate-binding protein